MRRAAAALLVLLAGLGGTAARAQEPAETTVRLLDRTPWVGEGVDFGLTLRVADAPAGAEVHLTVHGRVRSRSEFTRSTVGDGLRSAAYDPPAVALAETDADGDGVFTVVVPLGGQPAVATPLRAPGVYPVSVEVTDADGVALATLQTHLVRLPPLDPDREEVPILAAVVLPVTARPAHIGDQPPTVPDAPLVELAAVLAEHPDVPLTLVPTPETVGAAAVADPDATAALRGAVEGHQVLVGPWVALDEAAWQRDDPAELERQWALGRRTLAEVLAADPDGTRLAPRGTTEAQLQAMAAGGAAAVVVHEADLTPLEGRQQFTLTRPFALAGAATDRTLPALTSDPFLEASAEAAATDPVLAAHHLLADLAVLASDQPALRRVATVVLPPAAARSTAFLDALLGGLEPPAPPPAPTPPLDPAAPTPEATPAAAPVVLGTTVAAAITEVEPAGADGAPDPVDPLVRTAASTTEPGSVTGQAAVVAEGRADVATYEAVFGPDDPALEGLERAVASAPAAAFDAATRRASLDAVRASIEQQLGGLVAPAVQRVTLTAREGRVQLTITNDTGRPADVVLRLRGDRLVLPDAPDGLLPVTLAEQTTRVELRVEARSSGDAPLDVRLLTPDERIELGRSRITVRTTAVSGVGVALLATSAAFLVLWWTRTIVRERRGARGRHPAHAKGSRREGART